MGVDDERRLWVQPTRRVGWMRRDDSLAEEKEWSVQAFMRHSGATLRTRRRLRMKRSDRLQLRREKNRE
jgi:hypothetical protein